MKKIKFISMLVVLFAVLMIPHIVNANENMYVDFLCSYPNSESYVSQIKKIISRNFYGDGTYHDYIREFVKNDSEKTITVYLDGTVEAVLYLDDFNMVSGYASTGYDYQSHYVYYYDDEITVYEGWQEGDTYHIKNDGSCIRNVSDIYAPKSDREYKYDNRGRIVYSKGIAGRSSNFTESWIEYISNTGSLTIATKDGKTEGYSTINNEQGTGTNFIFTAVTSPEVKEISLLADLHNGEAWHEITYNYLKKYYYLDEHINTNNEKVWTCRFDINDVGYRTFILKTDGAETGIKANVNILPNITVMVNGNKLEFDVPPHIIDGRTLVPVRAVFEALGAQVEWNAEQQSVTAWNTNYWIKLVLGSTTMECAQPNSLWQYKKMLDVPATAIDGRTLVPARAVGEAFGCKVDWDAETSTVIINEYN